MLKNIKIFNQGDGDCGTITVTESLVDNPKIVPQSPSPWLKRPLLHFTPSKGWNNDPNGLVYVNGVYHMFYQYYPDATVWGPMHWGHAVSKDLITWEEKKIALYPDELGYIFSGSCVLDKENISGFGTKDNPPLIAIYTNHDPENGRQQQSIAYSLDYENFVKFEGNPVIPNIEEVDFRDPKVFENPLLGGYSMALAVGKRLFFYHTDNFVEWEKTGEFKPGDNGYEGICECPDCVRFTTEEGDKYVLIISMIIPDEQLDGSTYYRMTHVTQYYIGQFDGRTFVDTQKSNQPLLIDYGTDNYAAVTFANTQTNILLGWKENWDYAQTTPTDSDGYRGSMTLARDMKLVKLHDEYRVSFNYIGIDNYKNEVVPENRSEIKLSTDVLIMEVVGNGTVSFYNELNENVVIEINENEIIVDRSKTKDLYFIDKYANEKMSINRISRLFYRESVSTKIVFDKNCFEIIAEDGLIPLTVNVYPKQAYDKVIITGFEKKILLKNG